MLEKKSGMQERRTKIIDDKAGMPTVKLISW